MPCLLDWETHRTLTAALPWPDPRSSPQPPPQTRAEVSTWPDTQVCGWLLVPVKPSLHLHPQTTQERGRLGRWGGVRGLARDWPGMVTLSHPWYLWASCSAWAQLSVGTSGNQAAWVSAQPSRRWELRHSEEQVPVRAPQYWG